MVESRKLKELKERIRNHLDNETFLASDILNLNESEAKEIQDFIKMHPYSKFTRELRNDR